MPDEAILTRVVLTPIFFESHEAERIAMAAVRDCVRLLPRWVSQVTVQRSGDSESGGEIAEVCLTPKYNSASIRLYPLWFIKSPEERRQAILHEIVHVRHGVAHVYVLDHLVSAVKDHNAELGDHFEREFDELMESITEEWAQTLIEIMPCQTH